VEKMTLEVTQTESTISETREGQLWELSDLQLATVGGGAGDVTLS
jgi:hypothetical protein